VPLRVPCLSSPSSLFTLSRAHSLSLSLSLFMPA
jgi:hypothetical protein